MIRLFAIFILVENEVHLRFLLNKRIISTYFLFRRIKIYCIFQSDCVLLPDRQKCDRFRLNYIFSKILNREMRWTLYYGRYKTSNKLCRFNFWDDADGAIQIHITVNVRRKTMAINGWILSILTSKCFAAGYA